MNIKLSHGTKKDGGKLDFRPQWLMVQSPKSAEPRIVNVFGTK